MVEIEVMAIVKYKFNVKKAKDHVVDKVMRDFQDMPIGMCILKIKHKIDYSVRASKLDDKFGNLRDIPRNPDGLPYKWNPKTVIDPLAYVPKGDV